MANLTPLSLAHPKQQTAVSKKDKGLTFEERIKEGLHEPEKSPPVYDFHDYRDPEDDIPGRIPEVDATKSKLSVINKGKQDLKDVFGQRFNNQQAPSAVFAVKEKTGRYSKPTFAIGANNCSSSSLSSLSSISEDDSPLRLRNGLSVQPPANSPTDPRLTAPKGSESDILRTLSDASLALTGAKKSTPESSLAPKSAINDTNFRRMDYESDADADDEKEGLSQRGSIASDDEEDEGDSDKENIPSADNDDAGLHKQLKGVSLGTKRQRGEGVEEQEEGGRDVSSDKRAAQSSDQAPRLQLSMAAEGKEASSSLALEKSMEEVDKGITNLKERAAVMEEQMAKRVKALAGQ